MPVAASARVAQARARVGRAAVSARPRPRVVASAGRTCSAKDCTRVRRRANARRAGSACIRVAESPVLQPAAYRPLTTSARSPAACRLSPAGRPEPAAVLLLRSRKPRAEDTEVMAMRNPEATEIRVSRRKLLKRAGVGAAVVGAGSMVTSSTAGAAAETEPHVCIHAGGCFACSGQPTCGNCCGCVITVEGCCFCHEAVFCGDATPCHTSSQCPPGFACALTCCGGGPICVPRCFGNPHPPVCAGAAPAGATSMGGGAAKSHHPEPEAPPHRGHGHQ